MPQRNLFEDTSNENEEDLLQDEHSFSQAVMWGTDWTVETITNQLVRNNINLFPRFQRRDAWTNQAKSKFIESLLLGLPIPPIILAESRESRGTYIVIDGKQRLLTIRRFFANAAEEFEPFKLVGLQILRELNGLGISDLTENAEYASHLAQLQNQTIRTTVIRNWPNENFLFTVFLRINTGSMKLSPQELRQALHPGDFIDFADAFSIESEPLKQMLGLRRPDFRMRDVEMVIRFFWFKYFMTQYDGNLKNAFDNTVKILNAEWNERSIIIIEDARQLEHSIDLTIQIFGERDSFSKWNGQNFQGKFNRAVFDIMAFYFSNPNIREWATDRQHEIRQAYINLSQNDEAFRNSIEQTTKSLQNTEYRFRIWGEHLATVIQHNLEVPVLQHNNRMTLQMTTNA